MHRLARRWYRPVQVPPGQRATVKLGALVCLVVCIQQSIDAARGNDRLAILAHGALGVTTLMIAAVFALALAERPRLSAAFMAGAALLILPSAVLLVVEIVRTYR